MMTKEPPHIGRNVKRIREVLGIKQEYMAVQLGLSQQAISQLEQRETIEVPLLEKVAKVLNMPVEAIENYDDEATYNFNGNTVSNNNNVAFIQNNPVLNPVDKWIDALNENKKLIEKNENLYERLLQVEREKNELLQKMITK